MNTNIIDLLIKLKNASLIQKEVVCISYNKVSLEILQVLYREGFIQSFKIVLGSTKEIHIFLRYSFNKSIFKNLKFLSTPSRSLYITKDQLLKVNTKTQVFLVSTSKGMLTLVSCKKHQIGGKILFLC